MVIEVEMWVHVCTVFQQRAYRRGLCSLANRQNTPFTQRSQGTLRRLLTLHRAFFCQSKYSPLCNTHAPKWSWIQNHKLLQTWQKLKRELALLLESCWSGRLTPAFIVMPSTRDVISNCCKSDEEELGDGRNVIDIPQFTLSWFWLTFKRRKKKNKRISTFILAKNAFSQFDDSKHTLSQTAAEKWVIISEQEPAPISSHLFLCCFVQTE